MKVRSLRDRICRALGFSELDNTVELPLNAVGLVGIVGLGRHASRPIAQML